MVLSTVVIVVAPEGVEAARAGIFRTEAGWGVEVVDSDGTVGEQSSLAIDDFGNAHIAYRNYDDSTLKYATNAEGFWNITTVDTEVSVDSDSEISLALDSNNKVHISYMSYYGSEDENLAYATNAEGSWTTTVVDPTPYTGYYNDIFVDSDDNVHIAYQEFDTQHLRYANNTGGTWIYEDVDLGLETGMYCAIVVDDYGIIHIVHFDQQFTRLKWAHKHPSGWFNSVLDETGEAGEYASIAISDGINLHVSYYDNGMDDLKYIYFDGTDWAWDLSPTVVDSLGEVGKYSSICVGAENDPYIAYYDSTNDALKVASLLDGGWNVTTVDDAGASSVGEYCSIAIGPNGKIGVSNYYGGSSDLLYTSQNAWIIEKLAGSNGNMCFGNTDIVLDDDNKAYISYTANADYELWFATVFFGSWTYTKIDNTTGDYGGTTSIDLGPNNQVHIAYYASDSGEIRHATKVGGGSWTWEKVADTKPDNGLTDLSMKVDSNGKVHIAYSFFEDSGSTSSLRYANNVGGSWVNETIDDSVGETGRYPSLTISDNGKIFISYIDQTNRNLRWTSNIIGSWVSGTVDTSGNISDQTSIAVMGTNHLYVSYMDTVNHDLKYAYFNGGAWQMFTVDTLGWVGEDSSIGVDQDGKVHISYYDTDNRDLKYATGNGSSWSISTLDYSDIVGEDTSLAVGTDDKVHIAYVDATSSQVGYATNSPWSFRTVYDLGEEAAPDNYLSMAKDVNGAYHICFYDVDDPSLRYSTNKNGNWGTYLVDNAGDVGQFCSIGVDANGNAHISYYDLTNDQLKYATNAGGSWAKTVVDNAGSVGMFSSIALDANGNAHISYRDSTSDFHLKYATNAGGPWTNTTVDSTGFTGTHTDIAVDAAGHVHISYYTTSVGLKYANNTAGTWSIKDVDTGSVSLGHYTSLALDEDGSAHISYFDTSTKYQKYAVVSGASVTKENVDISGNAGGRSSIDIDRAGGVHISYEDQFNADLRYATKAGGFWWTTPVDRTGQLGVISSLDIDDQGVLSICYFDWTDNCIKLANQKAEPSAPRDLTLVADGLEVEASWSPPLNSNGYQVLGYVVMHTYPDGSTERSIGLNDLSRTDGFLTEGVHLYAIAAYNILGTGPFCEEQQVTIVPQTAPSAPTSLTATPGSGNVSLIWSSPVDNGGSTILGYKVYRGTSSGTETLLTFVNSSMNYLDLTVTNGATYYYKVSAFNANGEGPQSAEVNATPTLVLSVPGTPFNVVTHPHDEMVEITWESPSIDGGSPITNYKVYRGDTSGALSLLETVGNVLTYSDYGLENGHTYYYAISAVNSVGEGLQSSEVSATPAALPSAPRNLTAELDGDDVILTWEAPVNDGGSPITHYTIYYGTISGDLEYLFQVGNVLTYTDTMYLPDTTFYYQVTAINAIGESPRSNEVTSDPDLPSSPSLAAEAEGTTVTLTWAAPDEGSSAITNYNVYRGVDSGSMSLLAELGNVLTYEDSTGSAGNTYVYQVSAVNGQGEGPRSNSVSVQLGAVPSAPIHLGASAEGAGIVLTWDEPENDGGWNVTGYKVYRGTSAGNLTLKAALGEVLNYTDYDVVAGTAYYYAVSAVNEIGEGIASSVISVEADSLPSAPTHLEAEAGDATVTLSWNAPTDNGGSPIIGYVIYRGTTEGAVSTVLVTLGNVTAYTDDDVINGQTYWYKISAVNAVGQGTTTNVVGAIPAADDGDGGIVLILLAIVAIAAVAGVAVFLLKKKK